MGRTTCSGPTIVSYSKIGRFCWPFRPSYRLPGPPFGTISSPTRSFRAALAPGLRRRGTAACCSTLPERTSRHGIRPCRLPRPVGFASDDSLRSIRPLCTLTRSAKQECSVTAPAAHDLHAILSPANRASTVCAHRQAIGDPPRPTRRSMRPTSAMSLNPIHSAVSSLRLSDLHGEIVLDLANCRASAGRRPLMYRRCHARPANGIVAVGFNNPA